MVISFYMRGLQRTPYLSISDLYISKIKQSFYLFSTHLKRVLNFSKKVLTNPLNCVIMYQIENKRHLISAIKQPQSADSILLLDVEQAEIVIGRQLQVPIGDNV